ncbi:uncharacterized protein A4U43_C01F15080 [Asparagus officinalis]|uniref:Uncharacterized protein n=1 Tax=Asparagus officinalis TaxID=4686 RepID=A0A5P1FPQ0_ASPOF|nr:uncharacterized protein A4U43_C01F15080 [Asparagus officinalis]
MKNFKKLEAAYLSLRGRLVKPTGKLLNRKLPIVKTGGGSTIKTEGSSVGEFSSKDGNDGGKSEWIDPFLDNLCRYLSFSKLKVRADLKQGDLLNSSNLICCLAFDRDKDFFATSGVNRKIKIFEFDMLLDNEHDIHYPVAEMASRSKLSSICWNSYIKSQIASSDFEGVVQIWDVARSQAVVEMKEHERRVWSVDFSLSDPTKLASGSDDGTVKLWNINQAMLFLHLVEQASVLSERKQMCAPFNSHLIAASASTDNSLKLWDLSGSASRVLDNPLQTFTGHTNIKNFVGLSISDGYIATGSETNEVFVYHKAFPMPVLSYKFNSTDPISGREADDASQFISSVCWRGQSSALVAANSSGNIKILDMV